MSAPTIAAPVLSIDGSLLKWTSIENAIGYELYIDSNPKIPLPATTTSYSLQSITAGSHSYYVIALGQYNSILTYKNIGTELAPSYTRSGNDGSYDFIVSNPIPQSRMTISRISDSHPEYTYVKKSNDDIYVKIELDSNNNAYCMSLPVQDLQTTFKITQTQISISSAPSETETVTKLTKPTVTVGSTNISWVSISNATKYRIYKGNNVYAETTSNTYAIANLGTVGSTTQISVMAVGNNINYVDSDLSTAVYISMLGTPTISLSSDTLSWGAVTNATEYVVCIDSTPIQTVSTTSYDISGIDSQPFPIYILTVYARAPGRPDSYHSNDITKIARPTLNINGDIITWIDPSASYLSSPSYNIYIDNNYETTVSSTTYDLSNSSISTGGQYGITVVTSASGYVSSNPSNTVEWDYEVVPNFADASWSYIKSHAGDAGLYWNVGDTKPVQISGTIQGTSFNTGVNLNVYILGFDHDTSNPYATANGKGIWLGGFISYVEINPMDEIYDWVPMALIDNNYGSQASSSAFLYHNDADVSDAYLLWGMSYMRLNVLGSVSASSPQAGSLMNALPADFRNVLSIMPTAQVDPDPSGSGVEVVNDYCRLLSPIEIDGTSSSNYFEGEHQFAYFSTSQYGGMRDRWSNSQGWTQDPAIYWVRDSWTVFNSYGSYFDDLINFPLDRMTSYGIAPVFRIAPD